MDPEIALSLFEHGAVLIIAGVPNGTEFGIDCNKFVVVEKFRGVKMIPPGPHFVYCASQGPYGDTAPRVGFIHYFKEKEILVREWDPEIEELKTRTKGNPEYEKQQIRENLKELDSFLAPYDYQALRKWNNLTGYINEETVDTLSPNNGIVRTCVELLSCPDIDRPRGKSIQLSPASRKIKINSLCDEDSYLPNLKPVPGTAPNFTELPERCPKTASPSEISKHYMDSIQAVDQILAKFNAYFILLGEIQFSFVLFVAGCSIDALTHWRKMLSLFCNSESAVPKYREFYKKFLQILQYQLPELPEEMMEPTVNNTVYRDVRTLLLNCTVGGITEAAENLKHSLQRSMGWHFEGLLDEDPEDMPVIVET